MNRFEYASAKSTQQAIGLLSSQWGETEILAGGTDLLSLMKDDVVAPKRVVNIKDIAELQGISYDAGRGLRIGALTRLVDIAESPVVKQHFPNLADDVSDAASPQIRNMATIGGNLCQRPRCWYFRNGLGLLGQQDGKSLVTEGDNRYHAILGNQGPAYFVSPSTIAPMLIALGAKVRIAGQGGPREIALENFYRIPKSQDEREHDLKPNEIITDVIVPPMAAGAKVGNYEVRQKQAFDWPFATAVALLQMSGSTVESARIVMGAVAPVPWISQEAAQALAGKPVNQQTASAAAAASVAKARPLSQNGFKVKLAGVAVKRAILAAAGLPVPDLRGENEKGGAA
jgi:xanthine dehydrogenase YagS FAD-binding subunit